MRNALIARFALQLRCGVHAGSTSVRFLSGATYGEATVPAHVDGMAVGSCENAGQSGNGVAAPTHRSRSAPGLVESTAGMRSDGVTSFRKRPTPPRILPHGAPNPGMPV